MSHRVANEEIACSLNGPELIERINQWREVSSHATGREIAKGRIVSTYPSDPGLLQQFRKLIAAEAECCPFMQFDITENDDHFLVELRVPEDMSVALAMMLGLVTRSDVAS
jgi:MerR family transcriptional regulator, copper efflux regulator